MTGEPAAGPPPDAPPPAARAQAEHEAIDGIALLKEVALERLQNLLERLLERLKRYRAGRGNWWE